MAVITKDSLLAALGDLFLNPDHMEAAAIEIDCDPNCGYRSTECDTNVTHCLAFEYGSHCSNDLAEMLRALAALSRRDGEVK